MNISLSQSLDDLSLYPEKRFRKKSPKILKKIPNFHTMTSLKLHPDKIKRDNSLNFAILHPNSIFTRNPQLANASSFHLTPIKEAPTSLIQFSSSVLKNKYDLIQVLQDLEKSSQDPDIKKAKAASKALDICSSESGSYQKEMQLITSEISKSLYIDKKEVSEECLEKIYDKHIDALLDEDIPYFIIANTYKELFEDSKKDVEKLHKLLVQSEKGEIYIEFNGLIKKKDREIEQLKLDVEEAINAPVKAAEWKMLQLEEHNQRYKIEANDLQEKLTQAHKKISNLRSESLTDKNLIGELQLKNVQNEKIMLHLRESLNDLTSKHDIILHENTNLRSEFEKSNRIIRQMTEEKKDLESQIRQFEKEIENLTEKVENGAETLTPRPNFNGAEEIHSFRGTSTKEKVAELIKILRNLKLIQKPPQLFKRRESMVLRRNSSFSVVPKRKIARMFSVVEKRDDNL